MNKKIIVFLLLFCFLLTGCNSEEEEKIEDTSEFIQIGTTEVAEVYTGELYTE